MKRCILLLALGVMLLFASNANASLAPDLPPAGYPVAGEAALTDGTYTIYVDWIVNWLADEGVYIYLYQVENPLTSGDIFDEFSIQPVPGIIDDYGWAEQSGYGLTDLDDELDELIDFAYEHREFYFGNLSTEHEQIDEGIEAVDSASVLVGGGGRKIEWNFNSGADGIEGGDESDVLWLTSYAPPRYYPAYANNTVTLSGKVPAPMPEPSSMLLLGMGLVGFAGGAIRKRFKA